MNFTIANRQAREEWLKEAKEKHKNDPVEFTRVLCERIESLFNEVR